MSALHEQRLDTLPDDRDEPVAVLHGQASRFDRYTEGDPHRHRLDAKAALVHRSASSRDGHRYDPGLAFQSHDEATLLEGQVLPGPAAGAFRKDQERVALPEGIGGAIDGRQALVAVAALQGDEPGEIPGAHQNRQLTQFRFVEHPEAGKQRRQRQKDDRRFDVAGVIDRVDGGPITLDVLAPGDHDFDAAEKQAQANAANSRPVQQHDVAGREGDQQEGRPDEQNVAGYRDVGQQRSKGGYHVSRQKRPESTGTPADSRTRYRSS